MRVALFAWVLILDCGSGCMMTMGSLLLLM
jgi:hypothetical protein